MQGTRMAIKKLIERKKPFPLAGFKKITLVVYTTNIRKLIDAARDIKLAKVTVERQIIRKANEYLSFSKSKLTSAPEIRAIVQESPLGPD